MILGDADMITKQLSTNARKALFKSTVINGLIELAKKHNINIKEYKAENNIRSFTIIVNHENIAVHIADNYVQIDVWGNEKQELYVFNFDIRLSRKLGFELDSPVESATQVLVSIADKITH
jgi:hypothetical protein